ncbi:hypothetical protein M9H77_18671 [Catharanthus roseus]|uniref:Uncharacterized protein n=1 Tax=Catharanthus roseus TaxID=4058 RepID=A0ACC0B8D7_CATRO|nr:hypothetical protein M9H77_18671 [Catharanthus roseus]
MEPLKNEESPRIKELSQAKLEVEESIVLHVEEEISNMEHCDLMRDKNMTGMTRDAQGTVELLQGPVTRAMARRMDEEHQGKIVIGAQKRTLEDPKPSYSWKVWKLKIKRGRIFLDPTADCRCTLASPVGLRRIIPFGVNVIIMYGMKNYRTEYDEYHESYDHGAHTHEGYSFDAYGRNDGDGRWRYPMIINSFYGNGSYGDKPMAERRLMDSGDHVEHGDDFTFLNPLGTYLERKYFIEFNSIPFTIPRVDEYDFNIANCVSCVLGVEDRRSIEKEPRPILEDLSISLCLNPSSLGYEVSLEELKFLLESYTFQVSLVGDMCIIAFEGNHFLLVPSMINCLSSHFPLEDPLMSICAMFGPSCYGFDNLDDISLVELKIVGIALEFDRNSPQHFCTIT